MSDRLTIHHEVQPDNVGLLADDLGLPAAVKGEGNGSGAIKCSARITPQNREGAEAVPPSRNVYPRRAAQFVSVRQAHRGAAHDVLIHSYAPITNSARCSRRQSGSTRSNTGGGKLARPQSTRTGLFSFQVQLSQYLKADFTNPTESAGVLPAADRAGAATHRLAHAESRPFPFVQINHVHAVLLSDWNATAHAFAHLQKGFAA